MRRIAAAALRLIVGPLLVGGALIGAGLGDARAEDSALRVHVVVEAPASCSDEAKFWAAVTARTNELRRVPSTDRTPMLIVRVWEAADKVRGELSLRTAHGEMLPRRQFVGPTCDEVTAALALALVLAMEGGELTDELRSAPPADSEPPTSRPPLPTPSAIAPPPHQARPRELRELTARRDQLPRRFEVSMGSHAMVFSADGVGAGAGIFSETKTPYLAGRVSLRLEGAYWQQTITRDEGRADLTWLFLRGQICVSPLARTRLSFCGLADAGSFSAAGTQVRYPLSHRIPWFGAGVSTVATWNWTRVLGIELEAGVLFPLVHDDLVLRPNIRLHGTPLLTAWVGVGPVLHFH